MELLWRYGSEKSNGYSLYWKEKSVQFFVTRCCFKRCNQYASDCAYNEIVLNGKKWWSSGLGDPKSLFLWHILQMKLKTAIIYGFSTDWHGGCRNSTYVIGDYDAPHGHGEVHFNNVLLKTLLVERAKVLRLHKVTRAYSPLHALYWSCWKSFMIDRGMSRTAFGKEILKGTLNA